MFLSPETDISLRQCAVKILTEICAKSSDNTQMFIACNGVSSLVQILQYDMATEFLMIATAVQTIVDIFDAQRATQKADFCRLFMKAGLLRPMCLILRNFACNTLLVGRNNVIQKMINNICELNNTFSQADSVVKLAMSEPDVMENIVKSMFSRSTGVKKTLTGQNILDLCKSVKYIGMESDTRNNLASSGTLEMTCEMLKVDLVSDKTQLLNIHSNLIMFLADMCKLSKDRIGIVAGSRLLPYLRGYLDTESELKAMTLSVIMELYIVNGTDRDSVRKLIDDHLIEIYIDNLTRPYWCAKAINAILQLFLDDELNIGEIIMSEKSLESVRKGVESVNEDNAPSFLQKLVGLCEKSSKFVNCVMNGAFGKIIIDKFGMKLKSRNVSQVPAALLELVRAIFRSGAENVKFLRNSEMRNILQGFIQCSNMRQRSFALQILEFFD
jgi:hypothetical protein